jgi:hypothetical protein
VTREDAALLSRIDERTERMSEQLDALEKYVFRGNGKPALASRVDALEANTAARAHVMAAVVAAIGSLLVTIAGVIL